jgi:hypothetical protein
MTIFFEWLRRRHPRYLMEQDAPVPAPVPTEDNDTYEASEKDLEELEKRIAEKRAKAQDRKAAWKNKLGYTQEEIIIEKIITPKNMIRNAQFDPTKWDKDYKTLSNDTDGSNFATDKSLFDEPVRMLVVKNDGFSRVLRTTSNAEGYDASHEAYYIKAWNSSKTVVLPAYVFTELPTASSDGKLNPTGANTLARILRYTTQSKGHVDDERNFNKEDVKPGYRLDRSSPSYNKYYKDPQEMGVRLAAIKNYMSKNSLHKIAELSVEDKFVSKGLVDILPDNEIEMLNYIFNWKDWWQHYVSANGLNKQDALNVQYVIGEFLNNLKEKNADIAEIINFYNNLKTIEERKKFFTTLASRYNSVVQNKPQYSQNRMT